MGGLIGAAIIGAANAQAAPAPAPVVVSTVPVVPLGAAPAVVTVPSPLLSMPPVASHQLPTPPAPPLTVSVPQPVPPRVHFYCVPAQAYFPTVGSCPVPWQVVPY